MVVCSFCLLVPSPSQLPAELGFFRAREHKSGGFIGDRGNVFCLLFFNLKLTIYLSYSCQKPSVKAGIQLLVLLCTLRDRH